MDDNEKLVGYLTSGWYSPTLGTNIGFAMLPVGMTELGTKLRVKLPDLYSNTDDNHVDGEIVITPFKLPEKEERGAGLNRTGSKL